MATIEKTVKIEFMRRLDERILLTLVIVDSNLESPQVPKPEDVIQPLPRNDTEKVTQDMAKSLVTEFKRQGIIPTSQTMQTQGPVIERFNVSLSKEEYEKLGKPTVFDELNLRLKRKTT